MSITINYDRLAQSSPKALGLRANKPKPLDPKFSKVHANIQAVTAAHKSTLPVPAGTKRYYLTVPWGKEEKARAAGCKLDHSIHRWYIDNPQFVTDFANWRPSLVAPKSVVDLAHANSRRIQRE
jgi:hypothetical protein